MSALKPDAVDKHELGTTALPWKNLHIDAVTVGARATGANVPQGTEVTIGSNDKLNNSDPSVPVNVEIYGSLTVHGETTTVTSSNLLVKDKNIILNDGGAAESAAGAGLDFEEGGSITGYIRVADDDRANLDFKAPDGSELKLDVNADSTFTIGAGLTIESASILNQDLTTDAAVTFSSVDADGGVTVDNLTLDGTSLVLSSGDLELKASHATGGVILNANGGSLTFKDDTTDLLSISNSSTDVIVKPLTADKDVIFQEDSGTEIARFDSSAESLLMASTKKIEFGDNGSFIHQSANGKLKLSSDGAASDAIIITTSDAAGGIDIDAGTGGISITSPVVDIDASTAVRVSNDLELDSDSAVIKLGADKDVTLTHHDNVGLLLNSTNKLMLGSTGSFVQETAAGKILISGSAAAADAVKLHSSNGAGGVDIDVGTGGFDVETTGSFSIDGAAASNVTVDGGNVTLSTTSSGNVLLTSVDAITATGDSIDIDVSGEIRLDGGSLNVGKDAALPVDFDATTFDVSGSGAMTLSSTTMGLTPSQTFDLNATGAATIDAASLSIGGGTGLGDGRTTGAITLKSTEANATIQTATSGKIHLNSAAAVDIDAPSGATIDTTAAGANVVIDAQAGSILIDGGEADAAAIKLDASHADGGIVIEAGTVGVNLDATGLVSIASSKDNAKAVEVVASAGGIDILATGAAAGDDIDIIATGSSVNIESTEDHAEAIKLHASHTAGGIEIDAGTEGVDLDTTGQVALTSSQAAATAVIIEATHADGGIDLSAGGAVVVSVDADSVDIAQDVNITGATPTLTIGDAGAEDASIIFDGNAVDFHIGLDDSADKLSIGLGSTLGTTPNMTLNSADRDVAFAGDISVEGGKITLSNGATISSETNGQLILTEDLVKTTGNLEITGNLTVQGETTTVNVGTLDVEDKNIKLNKGGAAASAAGAGLDFEEDGSITGYIRVDNEDRTNLDLKAPGGNELKLDVNTDATFTIGAGLTISGASSLNQDLTTGAAVTFSSVDADGGVTVDNLTLDGTSLALSSGNFALDSAGNIELNADGGTLTFADGGANLLSIANSSTDVVIKPMTENKDIIFQEDSGTEIARFDSSAESLLMGASKKIQLGAPEEAIYGDGTDIHFEVGAGGDVNIPADIGLTFGHATAQKIEGNGTNLTLSSGADIDLTATADVNIPEAVGLKFGSGDTQGIEADSNLDLTVTAGRDLILTPAQDVVVSGTAKLEFNAAGSGEHITGDGTDLTVASGGNIVLDATSAVLPGADSADDLGADGTAWRKLYVDDIDLNGQGRIDLDQDADTSIRASEDDVISFEVGGSDKLHLKAASLQPHSSTTLDLGTAAKSFSDLYLADEQFISFQNDSNAQNVTLTHIRDKGLTLKNLLTTNASGAVLTLQTGDTDIAANDVLGSLEFQAPDEGSGTDAILVAAAISAVSEGDFAADSNATKLSFKTGASEAAAEKMSLSSAGVLTLASGGIVIPNAGSIGSAADTNAITISGDANSTVTITSTTASSSTTTGALKVAGGLGVAGSLHVGGDIAVTGGLFTSNTVVRNATLSVQDGTEADTFSVTAAGAVSCDSTMAVGGNLSTDGNLTVDGNSTVDGNTIMKGKLFTQKITAGGGATLGDHYIYLVNADNQTINLPSAATAGARYVIKQTAAFTNGTTIDANGTQTIDGSETVTLGSRYAFIEIVSHGTAWHIIGQGGTVTLN